MLYYNILNRKVLYMSRFHKSQLKTYVHLKLQYVYYIYSNVNIVNYNLI